MSVPQPPSPSAATPPTSPAEDGTKRFGSTPVWAFATSAIVTLGGAAGYVWSATREVVAMCDDKVMHPGQGCDLYRNNVYVRTDGYPEVLANAERVNTIIGWTALGLVVIGVAFGVLTFIRWRQDVDLKASLTDAYGPATSSHSKTTSTSLFMVVIGAAFLAGSVYFTLTGIAKGEWPYYIGTVLCAGLGLLMLWAAIPKNGQLVQTFDAGVRVVSGNKVADLPWRDVSYIITPAKGTANHSISGPGVKALALTPLSDHETLQTIAQQRTAQARFGPALEALDRGEWVGFGAFDVSREGIRHGRTTLPWSEYRGIALVQGQVTVSRAPKGKLASVSLGTVRDYALLVHVIDAIVKQLPRATPAV